ncbi:MAG: DUF3786 domain-containing protein [Candidatus Promineifilaceae bacterium]|nr:DUF3786 domain-containing protein [Candidatus Promineifilaceae bacterium]
MGKPDRWPDWNHAGAERSDPLSERVSVLHATLRDSDPHLLAERTGAEYSDDQRAFRLRVWEDEVIVSFPDFVALNAASGRPVNDFVRALLAYYFCTAGGTPPAGRWIAFSELPDGIFYAQAFQSYTGRELIRRFGNDVAAFSLAAKKCGGEPLALGDAAYVFQALPRVILAVVAWQGDEDFSPSYRLLFDGAIDHYLTTDACAVLGSALTRRLLREAETP